ncbi:hypothetical protein BDB01DRAFT_368535 [Pilobolus umbonatus]|nr:hypothetical protein BDB01DRAFT_368535 [Pilobolus umbonatus]
MQSKKDMVDKEHCYNQKVTHDRCLTRSNLNRDIIDTSLFFDYNADDIHPLQFKITHSEREENVNLPSGWKVVGRKQSIFELDTNIHTLGELYNTLVELRDKLPHTLEVKQDHVLSRAQTSSSNNLFLSPIISQSLSVSQSASSSDIDMADEYNRLIDVYPGFIFENLIEIHLTCISYRRTQPEHLLATYKKGGKSKALLSAVYAYGAMHAVICHPNLFGIYSFMNQLAYDAYQCAHELIEFDSVEINTVETLVIMYLYLMMVGQEDKARNMLGLAVRHIEIIIDHKSHQQQDIHRLFLWITELDWHSSIQSYQQPLITVEMVKQSIAFVKPISSSESDITDIKALKSRLKGLQLSLFRQQDEGTMLYRQLNEWKSRYLQIFLYRRYPDREYSLEDKHALHLHALYFSAMLQLYQQKMMTTFEDSNKRDTSEWIDYFHYSVHCQSKVENYLYASMNAAYGFIQVIKILMDESDHCLLPNFIDILSAACTILYFGNKVAASNNNMLLKSEEALSFIAHAFLSSTTQSIMQCPKIDRFIQRWRKFII